MRNDGDRGLLFNLNQRARREAGGSIERDSRSRQQ